MSKTRSVSVDIDTISDLYSYLNNVFPNLSTHLKNHKMIKCSFLINGKEELPVRWRLQDKIFDKNCDIYVVPVISGGGEVAISRLSDPSWWSSKIVEAAAGLAISMALSLVIRALMPPVKAQQEAPDRENDIFGSIVNTTDTSTSVALNYGMLRIGGQVISSDLETLTDQRGVDSTTSDTTIEQETSSGDGGDNIGISEFGPVTTFGLNDITFEGPTNPGNAGIPGNTSTTDFRGESQTPDQY